MMANLTREIVLSKLSAYLDGETLKTTIYEWALSEAVSCDFEELCKTDHLLGKSLQALIDINHDNIQFIPTRKALEYYRHCLAGEKEYIPLEKLLKTHFQEGKSPLPAPLEVDKKFLQPGGQNAEDFKSMLFFIFRVYVILFGACSLGLHLWSFANPVLLSSSGMVPSRLAVIKDSALHVIYAACILLPPRFLVRKEFYYFSFLVFTIGVLSYWLIPIKIVMDSKLPLIFLLPLLPFSAVPAMLALFLLLVARRQWHKEYKRS